MTASRRRRGGHPARWAAAAVGAVFVALCVVLAIQVGDDPTGASTRSRLVGRPAPDVALTTFDGTPLTSADLAGRTVVVNFWNSWCVPCRQEEPALVEFHARHRDDPDVVMVGIVRDDSEDAARGHAARAGLTWTMATDPGGRAALAFGTRGQPETYVVTPDGVVAAAQIGPVRGVADLETMLAAGRGR